LQVINLGSKLAGPLTNSTLPVLSTVLGWRAVARGYGLLTAAFALLWHRCAAEGPTAETKEAPQAPAVESKSAIEWEVFKVWAVWAAFLMHLAENNSYYAIMQLAPQIYTQLLGVKPANLGRYLAVAPAVNVCGAFLVAGVEAALHRRRVPLLRIQQGMTAVAAVAEVVFLSMFAAVQMIPAWRSPLAATVRRGLLNSGIFDCATL
jgi:predicted MFS family arabinose efflux permease